MALLGDECSDRDVSEPHWCSGSKQLLSTCSVPGTVQGDTAMDKTNAVDLMLYLRPETASAVFSSQEKVQYDPILYLCLGK